MASVEPVSADPATRLVASMFSKLRTCVFVTAICEMVCDRSTEKVLVLASTIVSMPAPASIRPSVPCTMMLSLPVPPIIESLPPLPSMESP